MNITISSTFVDEQAYNLVSTILDSAASGVFPNTTIAAVISTRESGDDVRGVTDVLLQRMAEVYPSVRLLSYSAKQHGRICKNPGDDQKNTYDLAILDKLPEIPDGNVMVGDMVIKGPIWCESVPSFNLHPDLPLTLGGTEGIYWNVIGSWVRHDRPEIGGMMHLAVPTLDAGTAVGYFRLPARGIVQGVHLGELWNSLPDDPEERDTLIAEQLALRDMPTHPLFRELRRAESSFEPALVLRTLSELDSGRLSVSDGKVFSQGTELTSGLDMTREIVGHKAIWPPGEGPFRDSEIPHGRGPEVFL